MILFIAHTKLAKSATEAFNTVETVKKFVYDSVVPADTLKLQQIIQYHIYLK